MRTTKLARGGIAILLTISALLGSFSRIAAQEPAQPTFRSSVAVVPITAVVRDSHHRLVRDLDRKDFEVLEKGVPRRIVDFNATADGPISVAFLFDTSGSMGLASNLVKGREAVAQLLTRMNVSRDEAALFTFHRSLRADVPFTTDRDLIQRALAKVRPWGLTSLYDAVGETARRLTERSTARRAVVVISDGVDTSSSLTSREVASLASSVDVPVYVVAVVAPPDAESESSPAVGSPNTGLADLAQLTGGDVYYVGASDPAVAIDQLMAAMRHQYVLAIESSPPPGWYPIDVKTKRKGLTVQARRAYLSETAENSHR
jgi:Ca-activated chloride channel family protein